MTKDEAIESLREMLNPGDTVYTVLRHVSRSGMSRNIDCYVIQNGEPRWISRYVAKATGISFNEKAEALRVGGCGMDRGFHVVYNLSRVLFHGRFVCTGEKCPSNDHTNAYYREREGRCVVCGAEVKTPHKRKMGSSQRAYTVCSVECATGDWQHSDGGYALKHRWM